MQNAYLIGIGASIRIGQEVWCLPYAGFLEIVKLSSELQKERSKEAVAPKNLPSPLPNHAALSGIQIFFSADLQLYI